VQIIVGFATGQVIDIATPIVVLSERLDQQFIIENRPGAGGNSPTEVVVRAPQTAIRRSPSVPTT
jgi:tripartite-type tricarboxylate transporter receptor subunit TctC